MPVSAATIPAPAAAARSSRSATGRRPERGTRNSERGTDGPTSVVLLRVPTSAFRVIRVPGYLPSHLCSTHAPAPRRAPRARPPPRAALESGPGRLDRAGALGAPPRNRVRGPGCAGCGGRAAGRRRRLAAAAWQPAPGGAGAHPRRGPEQGRTGGGGARARAARRLRDGTAGGADPRARGRATALWRAVAGSRGRGVPRAGAGKPEPGARRFADHPGDPQQLARPPAGGVPGGDCGGGGRDHRRPQPPERRSDALGGRPGGDAAARRRRAAARPAGVRPRGRGGRSLRELRRGGIVIVPRAAREPPAPGLSCPRVDSAAESRHRPQVTSTAPILAPELARAVAAQRDRLDLDLVSRAYRVSAQAHRGQKRESGDDYVSHSVAVATILAEQLMDSTTIAAALLHDVVEDSDTSLEDLAFKFLETDDYREVARKVRAKKAERERTIERLRDPLAAELTGAGLVGFEITGRPKNLWSIYKKMRKRDKPFEEIYDLLAVRVLVNTIPECYHVLGIIHHEWTPLQERIKDYIASPKSNGYQSLHTTVFGPGGQLYEIQIRTREMHHTAEYGIAAHWLFKEGKSPDELDRHLAWFRQLLELQQDAHTPEEFLEFLKVDLYQELEE